MTDTPNKKADNMTYSPVHHIPLGQAVKTKDGEYALRVKRDKNTYEVIPVGKLVAQIIQAVDSANKSSDPK